MDPRCQRPRRIAAPRAGFATAVVILAVTGLNLPSAARAAPAAATLDSDQVTLTQADDGSWSTSVGLTNLTDGPLSVAAGAQACSVGVGDGSATVPAAQHRDVQISIPADCKVDHGLAFVVVAKGTDKGVSQSFHVTAGLKAAASADWAALESFDWTLLAALAVVIVVLAIWWRRDAATRFPLRGHGLPRLALTPLSGLDATWSFKDSIVSNLTAASGLVAVILGSSDFLKTALGTQAEAAIAVASIAGALALALVGAAGVLVLTLKRPSEKSVSVSGLCAGSAVALGAAGGQVWAITLLLTDLKIGGTARDLTWFGCIAASVLLVGYAWVSLTGFLEQGTRVVDPDPFAAAAPPEVVASAITAAAELQRHVDYESVTAILAALKKPAVSGQAEGDGVHDGRVHQILVSASPTMWMANRSALP